MAKDPAFLFYSKDFYEGTRIMLPSERACYIDLLCYQHQHGYIPIELERVIMYCSGICEATLKATLEAKFKLCHKGYYNEKLFEVMNDRAEFTSKQSINGVVGQFFKKCKAILDSKSYRLIREVFENQSNENIYNEVKDILKDEATLKAMLEAKLKHLVNGNENEDLIRNTDIIYSLYPSKCLVKNTSTGKSLKDKDKIKSLLKTKSFEELKSIIEKYKIECVASKIYMKNFSTFLNNIPDYSESFEVKEKLVRWTTTIDKGIKEGTLEQYQKQERMLGKQNILTFEYAD